MASSGRGGIPGLKPRRGDDDRGFGGGGQSFGEYMHEKTAKLNEQYQDGTEVESAALEGVVVHADGRTVNSLRELADLAVRHGGRYSQYLQSNVTHVVVNSVPLAKAEAWKGQRRHFVTEGWLLRCAEARARLPEADFPVPGLHDPRQGTLSAFRRPAAAPPAAASAPSLAHAAAPAPSPAASPACSPTQSPPRSATGSPHWSETQSPPCTASASTHWSATQSPPRSAGAAVDVAQDAPIWHISVRRTIPADGARAAPAPPPGGAFRPPPEADTWHDQLQPLAPDEAVTRSPLGEVDVTEMLARLAEPRRPLAARDAAGTSAGPLPSTWRLIAGVARTLVLARAASYLAAQELPEPPAPSVRWLRSADDETYAARSLPLARLLPAISAAHFAELAGAGVATVGDLLDACAGRAAADSAAERAGRLAAAFVARGARLPDGACHVDERPQQQGQEEQQQAEPEQQDANLPALDDGGGDADGAGEGGGWVCVCGMPHEGEMADYLSCYNCQKVRPASPPAELMPPPPPPPSHGARPAPRGRGHSPPGRGRSPRGRGSGSGRAARNGTRGVAKSQTKLDFRPAGATRRAAAPPPPQAPPAAASDADGSGAGGSCGLAEDTVERWPEVRPHLSAWLDAEPEPDAEPLLTYASALVRARLLEDLGYFVRHVGRSPCAAKPEWREFIVEFADVVDALVLEAHGAAFMPCEQLREAVGAAGDVTARGGSEECSPSPVDPMPVSEHPLTQ